MTVTITRIPAAPLKPRTPRPTRYEYDVTGTRQEIDEYLAKVRAEFDPYDSMYKDPIEQPDGTWVMRGSSRFSCD